MIDRKARVDRHTIIQSGFDLKSPLQIGNGSLAMTLDGTGMQTFEAEYHSYFALSTLTHHIWHVNPEIAPATAFNQYPLQDIQVGGRTFHYLQPRDEANPSPLSDILRSGQKRLNLWTIGFHRDNLKMENCRNVRQKLDLWNGILHSSFELDGHKIEVDSAIAPDDEAVFRITGIPENISVRLRFSYPSGESGSNGANFSSVEKHTSHALSTDYGIKILRTLDSTRYQLDVRCNAPFREVAPHIFEVSTSDNQLDIVLKLDSGTNSPRNTNEVLAASAKFWEKFWGSGGCCDFSGATAPEAAELERRIVLSEYLTRINCAGSFPPAETGLACNSWFGRFHLEMHFFHAVQFHLWGRPELMERSMNFYQTALPFARRYAKQQGYHGARFPKSSTPLGLPTAGNIEIFLIWHLPHLLYYAELFYRTNPEKAVEEYSEAIEELTEFIIDYLRPDEAGIYHTGPPLIDAAEIYRDSMKNFDPNFESAYFRWALLQAAKWQKRRGKAPDARIADRLAKPVQPCVFNQVYVAGAVSGDTFAGHNYSHPMILAPFSMFQSDIYQIDTMRKTLHAVLNSWNWEKEIWGWDYPLTAIAAARLGEWKQSLKILLQNSMSNRYLNNGHNPQDCNDLPCYLPGNGFLLAAVAQLAVSGGFNALPDWQCEWENLSPLL